MTLGFSHNTQASAHTAATTDALPSLPSFGARTDTGLLRDHNEDAFLATPPLFVVADGMGGHAAGEVACEIALRVIADCAPDEPDAEALGRALEVANREVINATLTAPEREGMGSTCTAAILKHNQMVIAHVGDSRAYLLRNGALSQITRDHSLVAEMIEKGQITKEEARFHPKRSVITRALGGDMNTRPDLYELTLEPSDCVLLCSDGLTALVPDNILCAIMMEHPNPQTCAHELVEAALRAGGLDNVTAVVIHAENEDASAHEDTRTRTSKQPQQARGQAHEHEQGQAQNCERARGGQGSLRACLRHFASRARHNKGGAK